MPLDVKIFYFQTSENRKSGSPKIRSLEIGLKAKAHDIDSIRLALTLLLPLNQANPGGAVQLGKQLGRCDAAASEVLANFRNCIVDIGSALLIIPVVLQGQAHAIKKKPVQEL